MKLNPVRNFQNLYVQPTSGIYYFRMFRKGKGRIERSLGTSVLTKAKLNAERLRAQFLNEPIESKERRLIEDEWKSFLALQQTKSKGTYASMETQGRLHLLPFFGEFFSHEINESIWERYVAHSYKHTPGRKVFNDWKYFTMLMHHLQREGKITRVPRFRNPDPEVKAGRAYSDEEIAALLASTDENLKLQILMAVTMGMRKSEILLLTWDRVDMIKRTIHLRAEDTKIRKSRTFGISDAVYERFTSLYNAQEIGPVFPSPIDATKPMRGHKHSWETCRKRAKVKGRFHDCRHTFLTKAFKHSTNPALICNYAGLSLEEAQKTYLHFTPEDTRVVATLVRVDNEKK